MAEFLGRLDPNADASMLTDFDSLTDLEQAEVTLAATKQIESIVAEAKQSETGQVIGKLIVGLEDGRVTVSSFNVFIGKEQEK
jgi:hypothetical protein